MGSRSDVDKKRKAKTKHKKHSKEKHSHKAKRKRKHSSSAGSGSEGTRLAASFRHVCIGNVVCIGTVSLYQNGLEACAKQAHFGHDLAPNSTFVEAEVIS
jgi:hypothetical protein